MSGNVALTNGAERAIFNPVERSKGVLFFSPSNNRHSVSNVRASLDKKYPAKQDGGFLIGCAAMRKVTTRKNTSSYQSIRAYKHRKEQEKKAVIDGSDGRTGYVYICKVADGLYKIGMTTDVTRRIKELSISCPSLLCVWTARVRDRYFAEKDLQRIFKSKKVEREVFALKMPGDMMQADQTVNKYR